ncbi:13942_t:CDS:2, partial [Racocetra persica]
IKSSLVDGAQSLNPSEKFIQSRKPSCKAKILHSAQKKLMKFAKGGEIEKENVPKTSMIKNW